MSKRLARFLTALASDERRSVRIVREALDESDLTPEEKAIVMSRDPARVRRALGGHKVGASSILAFWKRAKKKRPVRRTSKGRPQRARSSKRRR